MIDYISTHVEGLLLVFLIFILPLLIIVGAFIIMNIRERAYDRGYDDAWNNAIKAQDNGRRLV